MSTLSNEDAAAILGMKPREILDTVETDEGYAVQTHDGRWSAVADGAFAYLYPADEPPVRRATKPAAAAKKA